MKEHNRISGKAKRKIEIATKVAWAYIGTPYKWGGDDPSGFDCSGFVLEIMQSVGKISRNRDLTAQGLITEFIAYKTGKIEEGCLVGYLNKKGDKIVHIEYAIDEETTIGASGGGSSTNSTIDAWTQNAYIKARPVNQDRHGYIVVNPFRK